MKTIDSYPGNPLLAFYENYTRFAFITHAFQPEGKEFWICLDSSSGVLCYFKFETPKNMSLWQDIIKDKYLGHARLIEIYPAHAVIPKSADVYRLFLRPQQGDF